MAFEVAPIVVATDFSDGAGQAVQRAAMLSSQHGAALELLHVVSRSSLDAVRGWIRTPADVADRLVEDARQALQAAAAALGVPASAHVVVGDVLDEILARSPGGSLLAVGAQGASPLRDAILGTSAERLIGRSGSPILVVRNPAQARYGRVLAAIDRLPGSAAVLAAAARMAPGARMAAVHAYELPFEGGLQRAGVTTRDIDQLRAEEFNKALQEIRALGESATGDATLFLPIVERGHAARLILEHARSWGADLLVMGKRRRSVAESVILGSTTRHVLADAHCDVLVVPLGS